MLRSAIVKTRSFLVTGSYGLLRLFWGFGQRSRAAAAAETGHGLRFESSSEIFATKFFKPRNPECLVPALLNDSLTDRAWPARCRLVWAPCPARTLPATHQPAVPRSDQDVQPHQAVKPALQQFDYRSATGGFVRDSWNLP